MLAHLVVKSKKMLARHKNIVVFLLLIICVLVYIQLKLTVYFGILKYEGVNIVMSPWVGMLRPGDRIPADYWRKLRLGNLTDCGHHTAASCAQCPQGHGSGWCNGDCAWDKGEGQCRDSKTPSNS